MHSSSKFYLTKRSNGFWYIGYFDDESLHWKSTRTRWKSEALKILRESKTLLAPKPRPELLSTFIKNLEEFVRVNHSRRTAEIYEFDLLKLLSIIGDMPLSQITPQHFDAYKTSRLNTVSKRSKEPLRPVTVNIELRTLKAAFNTAVRWKLIDSNPFFGLKAIPVPQQEPLYFTKGDFQKLLSVIKEGWLKEIVVFAVLTGMRRGEIVNLQWRQVDLQRRVVNVQSSPTFTTKHGKRRTIPLNDTAFYLLSAKHSRSSDDYVFTLNGKKIFDEWLTHAFKNAVYDAGLRQDELHFHSLRHTFASWLVQDGASLYAVQKLLGHSSSRVTEIYSHLQPDQMHNTVNRLDLALN